MIVAQRIKYDGKTKKRIKQIGKMLNGTAEPPKDLELSKRERMQKMQQAMQTFLT